ncbi:MAG: hypothetical protein JXB07_12450 [Anaerolineae bacterium]|nr:hypothetical protein [Anaerolineae bacterium]
MKGIEVSESHKLSARYEIKAQGKLDTQWSDWFNGMMITSEEYGEGATLTTLIGAVRDQSALRGILTRIWDLGLTLYSVTRLDEKPRP